jgi:hypothetical protein
MRRTYRHDGRQRDAPRRIATFHHATLRVAPHRYATREPLGTPGGSRAFSADGHPQAPVAPRRLCAARTFFVAQSWAECITSPICPDLVYDRHNVLGHAGLSDIDAELEQLSMDPRRSPQRLAILISRISLRNLRRYGWSATTAPRLPAPVRSEPGTVPFYAVSGFTIARAPRTVGAKRYNPTKVKRSAVLKVYLFGEFRRSTLI